MPFEKSVVSPVVADLLKVREWIAKNGFTHFFSQDGKGCFMCAVSEATGDTLDTAWGGGNPTVEAIRDELVLRYGPSLAYPTGS